MNIAMNLGYSASRDQLDAAYAETARLDRLGPAACLTPPLLIESDEKLRELIERTVFTPLTDRIGFPDDGSPYDTCGYLRWVREPEVGYLLPVGRTRYFEMLRAALPPVKVRICDRCGGTAALMGHLVSVNPPHLIAFFLDEPCREELGIEPDSWAITP